MQSRDYEYVLATGKQFFCRRIYKMLRAYVVFILYDNQFDSCPRRPRLKSEIEHNGSLVSCDVSTSSPSHRKTGLLIYWENINLFLTIFNQIGQAEIRNYFRILFRKPQGNLHHLGDLCIYTRIILKLILEIKSGPC
jgi:hypothetical protein